MIKKIYFKNNSCFLDEQTIDVFDNSKKQLNLIFGVKSSGKTSIYNLIKYAIYYIKNWFVFDDNITLISKNKNSFYNPNIFLTDEDNLDEFSEIIIEFESDNFKFKYEFGFNKLLCKFEKLSFINKEINSDWIYLINKKLIDYFQINLNIETVYKTEINEEILELGFQPNFKIVSQGNSIITYISSISQNNILKEFTNIVNNIVFFDNNDFLSIKNFFYSKEDVIKNKKDIIHVLNFLSFNFDDFRVESFNRLTETYNLEFEISEFGQKFKINSSKLSNSELKIILYSILFINLRDQKKIVFIDDFNKNIYSKMFITFIDELEKRSLVNKDFQLFVFLNDFLNEVQKSNFKYLNKFCISKKSFGNSEIMKIESGDGLDIFLADNEVHFKNYQSYDGINQNYRNVSNFIDNNNLDNTDNFNDNNKNQNIHKIKDFIELNNETFNFLNDSKNLIKFDDLEPSKEELDSLEELIEIEDN